MPTSLTSRQDRLRLPRNVLWLVLLSGGLASPSQGSDWPQILGLNRDGVAVDDIIPDQLPAQPKVAWSFPAGQGYAGPAVAEGTVYLFDRIENNERVVAIDRKSGKPRWEKTFPTKYRGGVDPDTGPRCVPLVHNSTVTVLGPAGSLRCLHVDDGRELWSRDLRSDFGAEEGYFGMGSTPMAVKDRILVNVGGENGAGIVAFGLSDGKTLWKSAPDAASYSAPTLLASTPTPMALFVTRLQLQVVDPESGRVAFRRPFGQRGPTVNAASPITFDDFIFVTSSYGIGAAMLKWNGKEATVAWENDDTLSSQYNTPVYYQGHLYGIHGREDMGRAEFRCIEASTGKAVWSVPNFGVAHLIRAESQLLLLKVDGTLHTVRADPKRFTGDSPQSSCRISENATRSLPAYSDGQLFVRDNQGKTGTLWCIDLNP